MTRNQLRSKCRKISFHNVQISAANPAGDNPKQDVPGLKLWTGDFLDLKKRSRRFMYRCKNCGFQSGLPSRLSLLAKAYPKGTQAI